MTTSPGHRDRRATLSALVGIAIGTVLVGIEVKQGAPIERAAGGMAILIAAIGGIWAFRFRSETASTLAGEPVDERWQLIHQRAMVAATTLGTFAALAGFAVMEAMGRDSWQFALMAILLSCGYLAAVLWYRLRL